MVTMVAFAAPVENAKFSSILAYPVFKTITKEGVPPSLFGLQTSCTMCDIVRTPCPEHSHPGLSQSHTRGSDEPCPSQQHVPNNVVRKHWTDGHVLTIVDVW